MASTIRRIIAVLIVVAAIGAVKWIADPARSRAFLGPQLTVPATVLPQVLPAVPLPAPKVSIVFVIDSSSNMQPRVGRNYFEMAREGIVKFLEREGFRDDGTYEISVIQYAKKNVPGYVQGYPGQTGTYHWFGPIHVVPSGDLAHEDCEGGNGTSTCATKEQIITLAQGIEHTKHFTGMLLESGLNEARELVQAAPIGVTTQFHVILLSTGEYRLPKPWPPIDYCIADDCASDAIHLACNQSLDNPCGQADCTGSRACHVREYARQLRDARADWASGKPFLSAIQLGPDFKNLNPPQGFGAEVLQPYGSAPDYCSLGGMQPDAMQQPDRTGFIKELCNWKTASSATANDNSPSHKCHDDQRLGKYARVNPDFSFGVGAAPGDSTQISNTIAQWLCEWMAPVLGSQGNPDNDYFDTANSKRIYDICDNCPNAYNPRQRDCNDDGKGDLCQLYTAECGGSFVNGVVAFGPDDDNDGLCNALDFCDGDNCLVAYWDRQSDCNGTTPTPNCTCDCNNNDKSDYCDAAERFASESIDPWVPSGNSTTVFSDDGQAAETASTLFDGIPDCAQGETPSCFPIPIECDLGVSGMLSSNFADANIGVCVDYPSMECVDHSTCPSGTCRTLESWLNANRWTVESANDIPYLQILPNEYGTSGIRRPFGSGYLSIDRRFEGGLLSPPISLPDKVACCKARTVSCSTGTCPWIGEQSFVAIDLDLRLNAQTPFQSWDIVLQQPCPSECDRSARLHLRLGDSADNGQVYVLEHNYATSCQYESVPYIEDATGIDHSQPFDIELGVWFRLTIVINNTDPYMFDSSDTCSWSEGAIDSHAHGHIRLARFSEDGAFANSVGRYGELNNPLVEHLRGAQILVKPVGEAGCAGTSCPSLDIGRIEIRYTEGCEYHVPSNYPCPINAPNCRCSGNQQWDCYQGGSSCPPQCN